MKDELLPYKIVGIFLVLMALSFEMGYVDECYNYTQGLVYGYELQLTHTPSDMAVVMFYDQHLQNDVDSHNHLVPNYTGYTCTYSTDSPDILCYDETGTLDEHIMMVKE